MYAKLEARQKERQAAMRVRAAEGRGGSVQEQVKLVRAQSPDAVIAGILDET